MPKRKASYPWDYFDDLENNRVRCRICTIEFNKKTSNQQNHLKRHHLISRPESSASATIVKPTVMTPSAAANATLPTNGLSNDLRLSTTLHNQSSGLFASNTLPTIIRPRITKILDPPRLTKSIAFNSDQQHHRTSTTSPTTTTTNPPTNSNAFVYNLMYQIQQKATADYHQHTINSSTSNSLCQQLSSESSSFHDTNDEENVDDDHDLHDHDDEEDQVYNEQLDFDKSDSLIDECGGHLVGDNDNHQEDMYQDNTQINDMEYEQPEILKKIYEFNGHLSKEVLHFWGYDEDDKIVDLHNRQIKSIDPDTFSEFRFMTELNLSHNMIRYFDAGLFANLTNLKVLDLSYNQIRVVREGAFKDLHQLETLYLSNNQLEYLLKDTFLGLESLKQLSLHSNRIQFINVKCFKHMKLLEIDNAQTGEFKMRENPIERIRLENGVVYFY